MTLRTSVIFAGDANYGLCDDHSTEWDSDPEVVLLISWAPIRTSYNVRGESFGPYGFRRRRIKSEYQRNLIIITIFRRLIYFCLRRSPRRIFTMVMLPWRRIHFTWRDLLRISFCQPPADGAKLNFASNVSIFPWFLINSNGSLVGCMVISLLNKGEGHLWFSRGFILVLLISLSTWITS